MRLSEAVCLFHNSLNNLDGDTRKAYILDLNSFLLAQESDILINKISRQDIINYLRNLKNKKNNNRVSCSTENRHYSTLKRFFDWLLTENLLEQNCFVNIPRRKANKDLGEIATGDIIRALSQEQIEIMLKRLKNFHLREQVLFLIIYTTGLRISEALNLKIQDISKDCILVRSAKRNKPRNTFLSQKLKPILKKYIEKELNNSEAGYLFRGRKLLNNNSYSAMSYGRARQLFFEITKNLTNPDGSKITIHQLRHTFATERAGYIDSILLMNLMGHSDIRTTLKYAKATNRAVKQAFDMFDQKINILNNFPEYN